MVVSGYYLRPIQHPRQAAPCANPGTGQGDAASQAIAMAGSADRKLEFVAQSISASEGVSRPFTIVSPSGNFIDTQMQLCN